MTDPRLSVIEKRLAEAENIIAVSGWKGGIGKSSVACVLSLILAEKGFKTGLFDLDFSGASDHVILGAEKLFPEEKEGIIPPLAGGVKLMSSAFFSGGNAVALRGSDVSQAMLELLAVTRWGGLDYLIIDTPPSLADANLDLIRWIRRARILAVTTPSKLSRQITEKSIALFAEMKIPVEGIIENMADGRARKPQSGAPFLGKINFDSSYEKAVGNPAALLKTNFARDLRAILPKITS